MNARYAEPTIIKKYANRRLYDTVRSIYITQEDLREMVKTGEEFIVLDAKTGDDLTRTVLTQIILELESKEGNVLPVNVLRQLIKFYGEQAQDLLPSYLDHALQNFVRQQDELQAAWGEYLGGLFPNPMQHMARQNSALFQQGLKFFETMAPGVGGDLKARIAELEAEVEALQQKLKSKKKSL